jgi:hypothetical protein
MLLLAAALLLAPRAHAEPRLTGPAAPLAAGAALTLTLTADRKPVFVDGCAAVDLERREGERWVPVEPTIACDGSAVARAIPKEQTFSLATPGVGEFRAVVAWGLGCVEGRPFALAACAALGVARTVSFQVVAPPPPAQR